MGTLALNFKNKIGLSRAQTQKIKLQQNTKIAVRENAHSNPNVFVPNFPKSPNVAKRTVTALFRKAAPNHRAMAIRPPHESAVILTGAAALQALLPTKHVRADTSDPQEIRLANSPTEVADEDNAEKMDDFKNFLKATKKVLEQAAKIQEEQTEADELISSADWNPFEPKFADERTHYILRSLLNRDYPKIIFAEDRFLYAVKDRTSAKALLTNILGANQASKSVGKANKFVLALELALRNGYQPDALLRFEVELAIEADFTPEEYEVVTDLIRKTWIQANLMDVDLPEDIEDN